ncbi:MAG: ADP-glyceromanno-heptose 6-epimerase [Candidatus Wallbacteria bacterium]|nr:ADP-glyceromanno-heptose 6-epimerase [Candidatus Wallbacteria bacterium]
MQKLIIVTGGAGFIGSALVWALNNLGIDNILIVDHLGNSEKFRNLVPLKYIDYLEKDDFIAELEKESLSRKIDTILHLGACSSTTETDSSYLIRNNFEYSKKLCSFALSHDVRFVYASSGATYGDGTLGFSDDETGMQALRPLNMYGYSKQMFDLWAQQTGALKKIAGLKYFNVFGPNEYHKEDMRSVVHKAYEQIVQTGKVRLFKSYSPNYGDGLQKRDFVYVKDALKATLFFYHNRNVNGIYNIGTGVAQTWKALVDAIFSALNRKSCIEFIEMPEQLKPKYQYYTCASVSKLRLSGFMEEFTPLEESVTDYVCNYLVPGKHLEPEK